MVFGLAVIREQTGSSSAKRAEADIGRSRKSGGKSLGTAFDDAGRKCTFAEISRGTSNLPRDERSRLQFDDQNATVQWPPSDEVVELAPPLSGFA